MATLEFDMGYEGLMGTIELSERGQKDHNELYTSTELVVEPKSDDIASRISLKSDGTGAEFSLSSHHVVNEETDRAFHAVITCQLNWKNIKQLRDYFDLLTRFEETVP